VHSSGFASFNLPMAAGAVPWQPLVVVLESEFRLDLRQRLPLPCWARLNPYWCAVVLDGMTVSATLPTVNWLKQGLGT